MEKARQKRLENAANLLKASLSESFGGQPSGSFAVGRDQVRHMLDSPTLDDALVRRLQNECLWLNVALVEVFDCFVCIDAKSLRGSRYRPSGEFNELIVERVIKPTYVTRKKSK